LSGTASARLRPLSVSSRTRAMALPPATRRPRLGVPATEGRIHSAKSLGSPINFDFNSQQTGL
jgi:hypothetical protein